MVVFSLFLIVVSGGLLVVGIAGSNDILVISSIALSLVAAVILFIGVWRQRGEKPQPRSVPPTPDRRAPEPALEPDDRVDDASVPATGSAKSSQTGQFGKRPDRAAWARTAVAAIARQAPDTPDILAKDRPSSVPDPATEIPQLMSAAASPPEQHSADSSAAAAREVAQSPAADAESTGPPPRRLVEPPSAPVDDWGVTDTDSAESPVSSSPVEPADPVTDPVLDSAGSDPLNPVAAAPDRSSTGDGYTDPVDEPPAELLLSYEERQLAECDREVFVIDGRPRFHLADCPQLADKSGQPLPISEATELGFTSCSLCTAATTVLAERK